MGSSVCQWQTTLTPALSARWSRASLLHYFLPTLQPWLHPSLSPWTATTVLPFGLSGWKNQAHWCIAVPDSAVIK